MPSLISYIWRFSISSLIDNDAHTTLLHDGVVIGLLRFNKPVSEEEVKHHLVSFHILEVAPCFGEGMDSYELYEVARQSIINNGVHVINEWTESFGTIVMVIKIEDKEDNQIPEDHPQ